MLFNKNNKNNDFFLSIKHCSCIYSFLAFKSIFENENVVIIVTLKIFLSFKSLKKKLMNRKEIIEF